MRKETEAVNRGSHSYESSEEVDGDFIEAMKRPHRIMTSPTKNAVASFKVVHYNVLADFYQSIRKVRKTCADFAIRFPKLKHEIAYSDADIILLQEVDQFENCYKPLLEKELGY